MDVRLPNGTVIQNVPDGTSQSQLLSMLDKNGIAHGVAQQQQPAPAAPNTLTDVAKSIPAGLAKGAAALVGLPGDVDNLLDAGANKVLSYATGKPVNVSSRAPVALPDSGQVNNAIQAAAGPYHVPQTTAGKYAETIASFAPAALAPGGAATRIARVVIPGAASEAAGEVAQDAGLSQGWQTGARVAGAIAGGIAAGPVVRSINALTSRVGVPIVDPEVAARSAISDAVQRDGGSQAVSGNLNNWRGNSSPALIDVTGNNVRRLVRAAASGGSGEAQNIATTYADRIAGNLQDNALALTRNLTPVTNSAEDYQGILGDLQRQDADFNYKQPYSEPATVTPEMVDALQGPEGRRAINQALSAASANRNAQQMAELQDLKSVAAAQAAGADPVTGKFRTLQDALSNLSAGSLDRVRIAMRETGNALYQKGANSVASGYFGRVKDIDTALDQTPGLTEARASYRNYAGQQEAVDVGRTGLNASPEDYASKISALAQQSPPTAAAPGARVAAGVGYRQSLTDAISRPAEGSTGVLNRIATSSAQTRNLGATFGDQAAADYQTGIGNEIDRVRNSRFISPNTGSQTELRLQDSGLLDIPTTHVGALSRIWDKIRAGAQITDQERTALVRMGTTEAKLTNLSRANPSLTSRALTSALIAGSTGKRQ